MTSFFIAIWSVDRSLNQESTKIEFASIELLQLQILNFEWPKVNTGRMRDLTLQDVISMIFLFLFFLHYICRKVWMLSFQCHWNHFISISRTHALHKTSTERQICQLPPIYSFLHLSSKMPSKHKKKEYQCIFYIKHRQNTN